MQWTSPCGALRETQGKLPSEASDYCMLVECFCMLYVYYSNKLAQLLHVRITLYSYTVYTEKIDMVQNSHHNTE